MPMAVMPTRRTRSSSLLCSGKVSRKSMRGSSSWAPSGIFSASWRRRSKGLVGMSGEPADSADLLDQAALIAAGDFIRLELDLVHETAHEQQAQTPLPGMFDVFLWIRQHHLIATDALARMPDVNLKRLLGEAQFQLYAMLTLAVIGMENDVGHG